MKTLLFVLSVAAVVLLCRPHRHARWWSVCVGTALCVTAIVSWYLSGWRAPLLPLWLWALWLGWRSLRDLPVGASSRWHRGGALAAGVLLSYCTFNLAQAMLPILDFPTLTGVHSVAKHQWVVKSQRSDVHNPDPFATREFLVNVYYPTLANEQLTRAPYSSPAMVQARFFQDPSLLQRLFFQPEVLALRPQALEGWGSGLSPALAKYPIVIFTPGNALFADLHSFYLEQLASHGYAVFAITHPGGATALTEYPDARRLRGGWSSQSVAERADIGKQRETAVDDMRSAIEAKIRADHTLPSSAEVQAFVALRDADPMSLTRRAPLSVRKEDVVELLDRLENLNAGTPSSEFAGRLDVEHIAVTGMSYGGPTASEVCLEDARCKVVINMDGGEFGRLPLETNTRPALWLTAEGMWQKEFLRQVAFERYAGPAYRVAFKGADHGTFVDFPFWPRDVEWRDILLPRWIWDGSGPRSRAIASVILEYELDFLNHYLKGQQLELLSGAQARPEATLNYKNTTPGS